MPGDGERDEAGCLFCRIARGEMGTAFVAESESVVAFADLEPRAPTHVLVVPRRHVRSLAEVSDPGLAGELVRVANLVAEQAGIIESGYRVLTNTGPDAGQTVDHLHLHVLGGHPLRAPLG